MRQLHKAAVAFAASLAALAGGGAAQALQQGVDVRGAPQSDQQQPQGRQAPQGTNAEVQPGTNQPGTNQPGATKGYGAGIGGQGQGQPFVLGPLDTHGMGAGIGCAPEPGAQQEGGNVEPGRTSTASPAPVPQYWLADASLFASNAGYAAQTLANESGLMVQAPAVLSNQAQFMITATDRAISDLQSLQASAETSAPTAIVPIRDAANQLTAARAQEAQTLEAANNGTLGEGHEADLRSAYEHLQAAERAMHQVGRAYGVTGFTLATLGPFSRTRAFGAGVGGKGVQKGTQPGKAPATKPPEGNKPPEGVTKPPEGGTNAPPAGPTPPEQQPPPAEPEKQQQP